MDPRVFKMLLVIALVAGGAVVVASSDARLAGNHQGYEPEQPIRFSHRLHAGELAIDCLYCHFGAEKSRHAGIPAAGLCMNCHSQVTAAKDAMLEEEALATAEGRAPRTIVSPEIRKLYDALGLDSERKPDPSKTPRPIEWVRVHNLPDFVWFDHRVHVARAVACESCHGPVQSMERVRQESDLSMGWCLDCHRTNPAVAAPLDPAAPLSSSPHPDHVSTDCASCHF